MRFLIWGHGNSWVIHGLDAFRHIVWKSRWYSTRADAEAERDHLNRKHADKEAA